MRGAKQYYNTLRRAGAVTLPAHWGERHRAGQVSNTALLLRVRGRRGEQSGRYMNTTTFSFAPPSGCGFLPLYAANSQRAA